MISGVTNGGALPVLERTMQFAGQRQRILADNIANLSTPNFRPRDVSVTAFQQQLGDAIDARRAAHGGGGGELHLKNSNEVQVRGEAMSLNPQPTGDNLLFHDGNDRDLDRTMQSMVENFMAFRVAAQFMRREIDSINTAIRERL